MDQAVKYYYSNDGTRQASQPGETRVVIQAATPPKPWSWCVFVTSIISVLFVPFFGLIAIAMATLAYVDHKVKDHERARAKNRVALGFAIAAYVIFAIFWIIIIAVVIVPTTIAQQPWSSYLPGLYPSKVPDTIYD